ncbi:MAG: tyrosine-type recombinase/integrase [Rhodoferax sp.]
MARPKKTDAPDLSESHELTAGLIERLTCPAGKQQAFLRDTKAPGLRVRATPASAKNPGGFKSFVFEAKLNRQTIRRTIGDVRAWTIEAARTEANRLRVTLDAGDDPRELERDKLASKAEMQAVVAAKLEAAKVAAVTVGDAWTVYLVERKPRWGDLHYKDHVKLARAGGVKARRGTDGRGVTIDMPLYPLMALPLRDLTAPVIEAWATKEAQTRPTSARLAWRLLKGFLGWCNEQPAYAGLLSGNPAKTKKSREALGKAGVKQDALLREQLSVWFDAVHKIENPVIAAALQVMLLTGARPGEVLALRWSDLNTKWRGITIHDKVEGERVIPLTPYVWHLISTLPKRNECIFSSTRTVNMDEKNVFRRMRRAEEKGVEIPKGDIVQASASGHITMPRSYHNAACVVAGIDGLSLHGLRRSFKSLTEWLEVPVGVVAQLMGHKPSATAEKHYTVRPLDLLRVHHERIEAWILEQAGVTFDAASEPEKLRVAAG